MREDLDFGGIPVLSVDHVFEVQAVDLDQYAAVVVRSVDSAQGIVQPSRIEWFMSVRHATLMEHFTGNHRRKLKRSYEQLATLGIALEYVEQVTPQQYAQFFAVYTQVIGAKEYPRFRLHEDGFAALVAAHPISGVFAYRNHEYVGGALVREYDGYYALSYSAYPQYARKELELGLGPLCFDQVYQQSARAGYARISYGRDTNLYGMHLGLGLLEYKLSMGCMPAPYIETPQEQAQTLYITRIPTSPVLLTYAYGSSPDQLKLYCATSLPQESVRTQFSHTNNVGQWYALETMVSQHRAYLQAA